MTTGKIKWFNPTKGYGFIEQEGSKDVFLHVSALEQAGISTLKEGEEIEFEIGENKGKQNAINIKKVVNGSG
jgi:CspA family cold shock protein